MSYLGSKSSCKEVQGLCTAAMVSAFASWGITAVYQNFVVEKPAKGSKVDLGICGIMLAIMGSTYLK